MKTCYLSGPISGLTYEGCTNWRHYAANWFGRIGIHALDPMRGKSYLKGKGVIVDQMAEVLEQAMSQDAAIVTRDRMDTTGADFVLCNLLGAERISIGTMIELGWADAARVPVVLVMEKSGAVHEHAFVRQLCGYRVEDLEDGLDLVGAALMGTRGDVKWR